MTNKEKEFANMKILEVEVKGNLFVNNFSCEFTKIIKNKKETYNETRIKK